VPHRFRRGSTERVAVGRLEQHVVAAAEHREGAGHAGAA
jgi:hypothetical protein